MAAAAAKKQTKLGIEAKKNENTSDWYTQVCSFIRNIIEAYTLYANILEYLYVFLVSGDHKSRAYRVL